METVGSSGMSLIMVQVTVLLLYKGNKPLILQDTTQIDEDGKVGH